MDQSRRVFVVSASAWAGLTLLGCARENTANRAVITNQPAPANEPVATPRGLEATDFRGTLIGPGGKKGKSGQMEYWLVFVDMDEIEKYVSGERIPDMIPTSFRGHAVVPHPKEHTRAGLFEKWGAGACEVDMASLKVLRTIAPSAPDRMFYGHAAWSTDGELLYAVESTDPAKGPYDGFVIVRDARTMAVQGEFPTYGMAPHDCHLLDEGKTLAITNGGGGPGSDEPGCVTFVDIASHQLLERVEIPNLMAGHLAITAMSRRGDLAVGCTPHNPPDKGPEGFKTIPGGLSIRAGGSGAAVTMSQPAEVTNQMLGETLSIAIDESRGVAGATTPAGDILTFWDMRAGKLLKSHKLPMARGIAMTLDRRHYAVTYGADASMVLVRADDLSIVEESRYPRSVLSGSHVITYDL